MHKSFRVKSFEHIDEVINDFIKDKVVINIEVQGGMGSRIYSHYIFITYSQ